MNVRNICLLILVFAVNFSFAQLLNRSFEYKGRELMLLGEITLERLSEEPFQDWYTKNYDDYQVSETSLTMPDSVTIFMGTWCGDSRREVPSFVKMLEENNFNLSKLRIICLNTGFQNYKQAPEREERGVNIHRVPTFIFHDSTSNEIGRIVESPVVSFEQDLQSVMNGEPYETSYPVVNDLIRRFKNQSVSELRNEIKSLEEEYSAKTVGEKELNTYGYVLWTSFQLEKADFVFELNSRLYPESVRCYQTLASLKVGMDKKKEAMRLIKKGLTVNPSDKRLLELKESLLDD